VLKQFSSTFPGKSIPKDASEVNLMLLDSESEQQLIKILCDWPRQVIMAAKNREPHRIAFYLSDVAAKFHSLWNQGKDKAILRLILADDFEKTCARIIMLKALQNVIECAFRIIGVTPIEELR
jgi:arginyl-tRNA synthetase